MVVPDPLALRNTHFEGDNVVYLLRDGDEVGLVDTGYSAPNVEEQLRRAFAKRNLSLADIDEVVLTHWHGDHVGLAQVVQYASGATISAHHRDAPLAARDSDAVDGLFDAQERLFEEWAMPADAREELRAALDSSLREAAGPTVETFADGDTLTVGGTDLTVLHTPGHTAGHCCFAFDSPQGREVFTGDALLPVYTPNVGGADVRLEKPLKAYLETLNRLADGRFDRGWPGHRGPIIDVAGRTRDIRSHHEERTERVLRVIDSGPATVWEVSAVLFGELSDIHILHGPGEAFAHLEHLRDRGYVERKSRHYRLLEWPEESIT